MTQAYFIVPGLLVPNRNVLKAIPPEAIACVEKLTQGAEDWTEQTLAESHQTGSAHLIWCWRVLTRSREAMATAPYRWVMQGGPRLSGQIWRLTLLHCDGNGGVLGKTSLRKRNKTACIRSYTRFFRKRALRCNAGMPIFFFPEKPLGRCPCARSKHYSGIRFQVKKAFSPTRRKT